jgi:hypothetical protein
MLVNIFNVFATMLDDYAHEQVCGRACEDVRDNVHDYARENNLVSMLMKVFETMLVHVLMNVFWREPRGSRAGVGETYGDLGGLGPMSLWGPGGDLRKPRESHCLTKISDM